MSIRAAVMGSLREGSAGSSLQEPCSPRMSLARTPSRGEGGNQVIPKEFMQFLSVPIAGGIIDSYFRLIGRIYGINLNSEVLLVPAHMPKDNLQRPGICPLLRGL